MLAQSKSNWIYSVVFWLTLFVIPSSGWAFQRLGPVGGKGGGPFADQVPVKGRLKAISFTGHRRYLTSIRSHWSLLDGYRNGGVGPEKDRMVLQRGEHIREAVVYYTDHKRFFKTIIVTGVAFVTNQRKTGVYGAKSGRVKRLRAPEGHEIIGFWGRRGGAIDNLGVITRSCPQTVKEEMKYIWEENKRLAEKVAEMEKKLLSPDERKALEEKIAALTKANQALKKELETLRKIQSQSPYRGRFVSQEVVLAVGGKKPKFTGTVKWQGKTYPFAAQVVEGQLRGTFQVAGKKMTFTAVTTGKRLLFRMGTFEAVLVRE